MNKGRKIIVFVFAILMIAGTLAVSASAQSGGRVTVRRTVTRPVVVRRYVSPNWGYRNYWGGPYWGSPYWGYSGFYGPYYESPYLRYQDQKFYLQSRLAGNQRELAKHQAKYRADGYISDKERRELEDDVRDVQRSRQKLSNFVRKYQVQY